MTDGAALTPIGPDGKLGARVTGPEGKASKGKLANEGTDAFPASGKILFQSEGAQVFLRDIKLYQLK